MSSVRPHSVMRGLRAMPTSAATSTHDTCLPARVRRASSAPRSTVVPSTSLASIDDRLRSTESAVDMMALTTATMTTRLRT